MRLDVNLYRVQQKGFCFYNSMRNFPETINRYKFESFGVKIGIESNSERFLKKIIENLQNIIPSKYFVEITSETIHNFFIEKQKKVLRLYKNGEVITSGENEENFFNYFFSRLRLTVAEFASEKVFLHAGVVGWQGKTIIIPGASYSGKTTLVAELIKRGADYFSDEYAVLDENGETHPFPKTLSVRGIIDKYKQVEFPAETFNAKIATHPVPVGMILLLQYEKGATWNPQILSPGNGILEILSHTVPIRFNPKFSLQVLNNITNRAIIAKSKRGEAKEVVNLLLKFFEAKAI